MKKQIFLLGIFLIAQQVSASELQDLKKRVEALEKEKKEEKGFLAGHDEDGFFIKSADGNYKLTPSFTLQVQHRFQEIENAQDTNDIFLRRGRVKFEGNAITKDLEYEVDMDFGTPDAGGEEFDLKDFYLDYHALEPLHIRAGQYKVPFGIQELTSSKKLQFVERSLASEEFVPGRDIGLEFWGTPWEGRFEYYAGLFNGDGRNRLNQNQEFLYTARFAINPLGEYKLEESDLNGSEDPNLTFGGEFFYNRDRTARDNFFVFGGFGGLKYKGFSLRGEYFRRFNRNDRSTAANDQDAQGYYAQAGYMLIPKHLEWALRGSQVFRRGVDNDEQEYASAFTYFFKGHHAKLQLDYTFKLDQDAIAGANDERRHIVRTQAQVYF
ncbi:MAG: hypothetical protein A3F82_04905 [Deltaproteobacteria bacterium RIFCSPLOWO2_12_FULL_44_12]|nr:MAG: hypothetical protein A2712_05955 [Deltaproteobacteria bacterium RIFCSPHIGHO2_01_FULL_43_49]OGQ16675.1 MAG: hypothetical protein A3D22_07080 [Deltaproteobacteria bacterium RIFCSPHIGHO2_02_FULL_44_53]OGQ29813.1 MAG: hypothetical protein A3D98_09745 [Deltaproteobacteria bacterium RIFCSPHIGHO2_12_FULL_44_21]OGQ33103.1 MAG: hypothetical protein A2979_03725 [Deltaproteobacteria bacterium RIFCSPLOWO2_01_FULL_45_74]OGQ42198.1 MAG: hypothetical protein A3I70_06030 [Deltaproteobacteria bacterium 